MLMIIARLLNVDVCDAAQNCVVESMVNLNKRIQEQIRIKKMENKLLALKVKDFCSRDRVKLEDLKHQKHTL